MTRNEDAAILNADGLALLAPESTPWHLFPMRRAESRTLRNADRDPLGPNPERSVEAFRDLGLNDDEIAHYFGTSPHRIKRVSDGGKRSDSAPNPRKIAKLVRTKFFDRIF